MCACVCMHLCVVSVIRMLIVLSGLCALSSHDENGYIAYPGSNQVSTCTVVEGCTTVTVLLLSSTSLEWRSACV